VYEKTVEFKVLYSLTADDMRKGFYSRLFFIPVLGMVIPFVLGIVTYRLYTLPELLASASFFIISCFVIWQGSALIHHKLRLLPGLLREPFARIAAIVTSVAAYTALTAMGSMQLWYKLSHELFNREASLAYIVVTTSMAVFFCLAGEIILLTLDREADLKLVNEMEEELNHAGLLALTNEMDPHFIFNSLNAMNHLILNNPTQAHLFNNNLASVFKYFLLNKNRKLIPIGDELDFIDNYFYLLQIRYENRLDLQVDLGAGSGAVLIPPCALQVLVENAIKHNQFSVSNPLVIKISMNGQHLKVSNNIRPKPYAANSTNTGLKNLSSRFKLICRKDISVENSPGLFTVKLPVIKSL
jgi:two-component system, LytTR family, sensor kinase